MQKIEFRAMGCQMAAFLDNPGLAAARALDQTPADFEEWEQAISRFRPDSDLNELNASAGTFHPVSPILWDVIQSALSAARWTGGLVNPCILSALEHAGYDRSFDLVRTELPVPENRLSSETKERSAVSPDAWRDIALDENRRAVRLPEGVRLDLGGVGKGWAALQAARRLNAFGPALVDAGGDIAVSSSRADGSPWPVAIADPLEMQEALGILALRECGVATSGIDYRRWLRNGFWKHHIIDPRSGEPAQTDLLSVTIIAPEALQAEAAAKAVLILGSRDGMTWLENQAEVCGLLAFQDGRVIYSRGFENELWGENGD